MEQEILINTQLALFFERPIYKPEEFWQDLNYKLDNIFDKTPIIFPVPDDLKLYDIPIVQMTSSTGIYSCNISRSRSDFFISGSGTQTFFTIKDDFLRQAEKYFNFFKEKKEKIKRIGFVTRFFFEDKSQDKIIAKLLNEDFKKLHWEKGIDSTHEVYLRYVSRIKINQFEINNFTVIERFFARISGTDEDKKGILVTRDFNTISEKEIEYKEKFENFDVIKTFIVNAGDKLNLDKLKQII